MSAIADVREAIMERLVVIAATVVDPANVFRNQTEIPEKARPAIVILDADENTDPQSFARKRSALSPLLVEMVPEHFILVEGGPDKVGQTLNDYRRRYIKAILTDAPLVALCHDGDIRYEGFATGLAVGRSMEGESGIRFTFVYMLKPHLF